MAGNGKRERSSKPKGKAKESFKLGVPTSFEAMLGVFRPCFSAWTFPVFLALACGMVAQVGRRTVCGMLVGARLSQLWSHHKAHRFFSHARWSQEAVSAVLARLVVRLLVPADAPLTVAVDDTLFQRRGRKVHAAGWFHDGSATGERKVGYGNNWVITAIVVRLSFLDRPLALPVGFALIAKGTEESSRLEAARRLVVALAEACPGRHIDVVADSAYAGKALRGLPTEVTWTTRLRSNAALYELAPPRTAHFGESVHPVRCFRTGRVGGRLAADGDQTPELTSFVVDGVVNGLHSAAILARRSVEVAIEDAKGTIGVGEARNRVRRAVERTVPFGFIVGTIAVLWYATVGHHPDDVAQVRALAPWYRDKVQPSVLDMFAKLRRVIVAAQFRREEASAVTSAEINLLRLAWENAAV